MREILIVGAGPAGLHLADELQRQHIPVSIVGPELENTETSVVFSTPVITARTMRKLHLTVDPEAAIQHSSSIHRPLENFKLWASFKLTDIGMRRIQWFAPSYRDVRDQLLASVSRSGEVALLPGKVSGVLFEDRRVIGVHVNGQDIHANLVVDATGRSRRVMQEVGRKYPESMQRKEITHPTKIIGAYVKFRQPPEGTRFSSMNDTLYFGVLKGGIAFFMAPAVKRGEYDASHLIMVEGDVETIKKATEEVREIGKDAPTDQYRFNAISQLAEGTVVGELLEQVADVKETVYFEHKSSSFVTSTIPGVLAIGDAALSVNPILGQGFANFRDDIAVFMEFLHEVGGDIEQAASEFRKFQNATLSSRLKRADNGFQRIRSIIQTSKPLKSRS